MIVRNITIAMAMLITLPAMAQTDTTKVVVIPMAGDEANCTWRESSSVPLDTWFTHIYSYCEADERIISGGFRYNGYQTSKNCRVIANLPVFKGGPNNDGWRVTWGMPNQTECADYAAITTAFCCKN